MKKAIFLFCILTICGNVLGQVFYTETFTSSTGWNLSDVGWNYVGNGGSGAGLANDPAQGTGANAAWIWHPANIPTGYECVIYTMEYTVDTSVSGLGFEWNIGKGQNSTTSPAFSLVVQVGGNWYISKAATISTLYPTWDAVSMDYNPAKENWDTYDISTAHRGSGATLDLSGNITGFGVYTDSGPVGGIGAGGRIDEFSVIMSPPEIYPLYSIVDVNQEAVFRINTTLENINQYNWYKTIDQTTNTPGDDILVQSGDSNSLSIATVGTNDEGYYYSILTDSNLQNYVSTVAGLGVKRMLALWTLDSDPSSFSGTEYINASPEDSSIQNATVNGTPVFVPGVNPAVTNEGVLVDPDNGWAIAGTWDPSEYTNQFTISLWAKYTTGDVSGNLISKKDGNTTDLGRWQLMFSDTDVIFWAEEKGAIIEQAPQSQWVMITVTYDNETTVLYLNGVETGTDQFVLAENTAAPISIGKWSDQTFDGILDDIRIYNYALTKQAVANIYFTVTGQFPCNGTTALPADVTGSEGTPDCNIDFYDFVHLAEMWLDCQAVYQQNCF